MPIFATYDLLNIHTIQALDSKPVAQYKSYISKKNPEA